MIETRALPNRRVLPTARRLAFAASCLLLTACLSGGCNSLSCNPDAGPVGVVLPPGVASRITVSPAAFLLTGTGESAQLTATVFDADGIEVSASIEWTTSDGAVITVDADGLVTAAADLGSAQITAQADGVSSAPVMGVIAKPVAGTTLVSDAQVLADPTPVDEQAEYGLGYLYRVTLTGIPAPAVGSMLLGTGAKPVGGRVVEVVQEGENIIVTLEVVSPEELVESIVFNQTMDLSQAEYNIPDNVAEAFHVIADEDGTLHFTPAAPADAKGLLRAQVLGTTTNDPFFGDEDGCKLEGDLPINLTVPPVISLSANVTVDFSYDSSKGGFQKLIVSGQPKATIKLNPTINVAAGGKFSCEKKLVDLRVPALPPPLGLLVSAVVPVGIGFEVAGSLTAARVGFEVSGEVSSTFKIGVDCIQDCRMVTQLDANTDSTFKGVWPNPQDLTSQFQVKLDVFPYVYGKFELGGPFKALRFEVLTVKFGPKLALDLMTAQAQAADDKAASSMKLTLTGEAAAGKAIEKFKNLLKIGFTELKFTLDVLLAQSPIGTLAITPAEVEPGDDQVVGEKATFTTTLNKSTFLGFEAVEGVEHFWWKNGLLEPGRSPCTMLSAAPGQKVFTCEVDFLEEHRGEQEFFAFYHAKLFGVPLPFPIEVSPDGKAKVKVKQKESSFEGLGFLPGAPANSSSIAYGVSPDGSIVVGGSRNADGHHEAFSWTADGGMVGLGFLPGIHMQYQSEAHDVSADGSVVVGQSTCECHGYQAVRWTNGDIVGLGYLPTGNPAPQSFARAVSPDGSVVVGYSSSSSFDRSHWHLEAFRRSGGGMTGLGFLPAPSPFEIGHAYYPNDVSADGSVVVGVFVVYNPWAIKRIFIWDQQSGMRLLRDVFINDYGLGDALADWSIDGDTFVYPTRISADGRTLVGGGRNPAGHLEAWRAVLADPQ